jgi:hypothetical protein
MLKLNGRHRLTGGCWRGCLHVYTVMSSLHYAYAKELIVAPPLEKRSSDETM